MILCRQPVYIALHRTRSNDGRNPLLTKTQLQTATTAELLSLHSRIAEELEIRRQQGKSAMSRPKGHRSYFSPALLDTTSGSLSPVGIRTAARSANPATNTDHTSTGTFTKTGSRKASTSSSLTFPNIRMRLPDQVNRSNPLPLSCVLICPALPHCTTQDKSSYLFCSDRLMNFPRKAVGVRNRLKRG